MAELGASNATNPLREPNAAWLRALVAADLDAQFILEPLGNPIGDYRTLHANEVGAAMFGTTPNGLIGRLLSEVSPPYGSGFREDLRTAHETQSVVRRVTRRIAPQIAASQAEYRIIPFDGLLAIAVTDRTEELAATAQSAMFGRLLSEEISHAITPTALLRPVMENGCVVDIVFEQANDGAAALFALERDAVVGRKLYDLVERTTGGLVALVDRCVHTRQSLSIAYDARFSPIQPDWVTLHLTPVGDYVIVHAEDISQRRREEATLRTIVEQTSELIAMSDRNGYFQYINPAALRVLGWDEQSLPGRSLYDLVPPDDREDVLATFLTLRSGFEGQLNRVQRVVTSNGDVRVTVGSTVALRAQDGSVDGFVTVASDITDRLASEEARSELAAELGLAEQRERERLAEDLHDGPVQDLTALSMQLGASLARFQHRPMAENPGIAPMLELLRNSEDIVVNTIAELRTLMFRLAPPDLEGLGLGHALRLRAERIFAATEVQVSLTSSVDRDLPTGTLVTLFRLGQEALVNAFKHGEASRVTIDLALVDDPSFAVLVISDDGRGADESDYLRRRDGHLGIGMMLDRARQLGGTCTVSGRPGAGTVVRIALPIPST